MSADLSQLARRLSGAHGPAGAEWVAGLPELTDEMARLWDLQPGDPITPVSYSYVLHVRLLEGEAAILKLRYPGSNADREIEALRAYAGQGAVRLMRYDRERGALLIESASPGSDAVTLTDQEASRALVAIMEPLHSVLHGSGMFPTTYEWGEGFRRYLRANPDHSGPIPSDLLEAGAGLYEELEDSAAGPALLHGDLHHANMRFDRNRGWLAIDPQGVIGEPAYEMGAFLRNPIDQLVKQPDLASRTRLRAELLASLTGIDRRRILGWAVAQAVLSAIWAWEDQEPGVSKWVTVAAGLLAAWKRN